MKKINFAYLLLTLIFFSCSNVLNDYKQNGQKVSELENGFYKIPVSINIEGDDAKYIAIPDFSAAININHYIISADLNGNVQTFEISSSGTGSILLSSGTYVISAYGYLSSDETKPVVKTVNSVSFNPISEDSLELQLSRIFQSPDSTDRKYNGTAKLSVIFPAKQTGYPETYYVKIGFDGIESNTVQVDLSESPVTKDFEITNDGTSSNGITPGVHNVVFTVSENSSFDPCLNISESAVIYSNIATCRWKPDGNGTGVLNAIQFTHNDLAVITAKDYAFYVHGNSGNVFTSDTAAAASVMGKKRAVQCSTIQEAVNIIQTLDPTGTSQFIIGIDGKIENDNMITTETMITIGESGKIPDILLKGFKAAGETENAVIDAKGYGRIMTINDSYIKEIQLQDITFQNARLTTNDGGAIYIKNNDFSALNNPIIIDSCNFNTNSTIYSSGCGGAIYIDSNVNKISFVDCKFDDNYASQNAGAIYLSYNNKDINFTGRNIFTGNYVLTDLDTVANAISINGGNSLTQDEVTLSGCIFNNNKISSVTKPSCIFAKQCKLNFIDCTMNNNFDSSNTQYDIYNETNSNITFSGENTINSLYMNIETSDTEISNPIVIKSLDSSSSIKYKLKNYNSDYTLVKLDSECEQNIETIMNKFVCLDTEYELKKIDSESAKVTVKSTDVNSGLTIIDGDTITFELEFTNLDYGQGLGQSLKVKINNAPPVTCKSSLTDFTGITVSLYCGLTKLNSGYCTYYSSYGDLSFVDTLPIDDYQLEIKGKYKGVDFSQTIDITVR